jgi:hypothetical protein
MNMAVIVVTTVVPNDGSVSRPLLSQKPENHIGNSAGTCAINHHPEEKIYNGIHGFPLSSKFKQPAAKLNQPQYTARLSR